MKRIKDIACISRPSANIRIKPAIMLLERYCFLNIQRYIIATSLFELPLLMILLAKAGTHIHLFIHSPLSRGAKKGEADLSASP